MTIHSYLISGLLYHLHLSIRNIADMLTAEGYYTIVPKVLSPSPDGREGGDGELVDKNKYSRRFSRMIIFRGSEGQ